MQRGETNISEIPGRNSSTTQHSTFKLAYEFPCLFLTRFLFVHMKAELRMALVSEATRNNFVLIENLLFAFPVKLKETPVIHLEAVRFLQLAQLILTYITFPDSKIA